MSDPPAASPDGGPLERWGSLGDGGFSRRRRVVYATVWLVFLAFPLVDAFRSHDSPPGRALTIIAVAAFVAVYLAQIVRVRTSVSDRLGLSIVAFQLAVAVTLTLADRSGWATLFVFTVAGATMLLRSPFRLVAWAACGVLCPVTSALGGGSGGTVLGYSATTIGIGLMTMALADLRARNLELSQARAELAQMAVAQERARFARDLHDLLGHSLSVIALKSELAGRLLPGKPERALEEVRSVERVAREALGEVRDAVSGYRRPTLDSELSGARMALSAAGIDAEVTRAEVTLEPAVEAVLAWGVREGATNVIRHSGASRCMIHISASLSNAVLEVIDDGGGAASGNGAGGNGLKGLAERVDRLQGRIDTAPPASGGFRLMMTLPAGPA